MGSFGLHTFNSNSRDVVNSVPESDRGTDTRDDCFVRNDNTVERVLGVHWSMESDTLQFRITMKDTPFSRREILSKASSVFDPLGLVASFILVGKEILQELCRDGVGWDDGVKTQMREVER